MACSASAPRSIYVHQRLAPLAEVVEAQMALRYGGAVVWAEAVLRVARSDGRPVLVGAASVGWAIADDRIAAWLGAPTDGDGHGPGPARMG